MSGKTRPKRKSLTTTQIISQHKTYMNNQMKKLKRGDITTKQFKELSDKRMKKTKELTKQINRLKKLNRIEKNYKTDVMANKGKLITKKKKIT